MKKFVQSYENAQAYAEVEKLPVGAYKIKIENVRYEDNSAKGWNDKLVLAFDIVEGEQKGFFRRNFESQPVEDKKWKGTYRLNVPMDDGSEADSYCMRRFKTVMTNFEKSNSGYHWDWNESSLKGKVIGAIFNEKEYDFNGRHGFFTNCYSLIATDEIANAKIPGPTMLKNSSPATSGNIPSSESEDEEIPF